MLGCADGQSNTAVAKVERVTGQTVGKWRARFVQQRLAGLDDAARSGAPRGLPTRREEMSEGQDSNRVPADRLEPLTLAMRVLVYSDLHREFSPNFENRVATPEPQLGIHSADLVILAGDTDTGVQGVRWARRFFDGVPVLYILGNHEYYGHQIGTLTKKLRSEASGSLITVLDDESTEFSGYRFFGATLWTDFAVHGDRTGAMREAGRHPGGMSDFRRIRRASDYRRFQPADAVRLHSESLNRLSRFLEQGPRERNVVITHHAPSPRSLLLHASGGRDPMDPAYASDLESLIESGGPVLWVHGHIHSARDYMVGSTRIICNPRGYPDEKGTGFRSDLVVDLPAPSLG